MYTLIGGPYALPPFIRPINKIREAIRMITMPGTTARLPGLPVCVS
jgi:hypothetical protein